ncbi:GDCCVxC domain-containing (seleno)protein [Bradyrhizobium sp. TZ2]
MQLESTLTCPQCRHQVVEQMPTDACRFFYDCAGCGVRLRPLTGDCCVFCSYGSVPCPPIQKGASPSAAPESWCPRNASVAGTLLDQPSRRNTLN